MRLILLILVTLIVALGASWLLWRDRLTPTRLITPPTPPPTAAQRQLGSRMSPQLEAAMERKLPEKFDTSGGFDAVIKRMRDAGGVRIFVNWPSVGRYGGVNEQTPVKVDIGGMTLRQALTKMLASLPSQEPMGAYADDDALFIDAGSQLAWATMTRVYDVRDLLGWSKSSTGLTAPKTAPTTAAAAMVAQIEQEIAPGTWRPPTQHQGPRRRGSIQHLSGQLIVTQTAESQYDVVQYLNGLRITRARWDFAGRAGCLSGGGITAVLLVALTRRVLRRRTARRGGLCRRCGYDLRASEGRCPECGTEFTAPAAPSREASLPLPL